VAGVANKTTEYDEADAQRLTLLMRGWWALLGRLRLPAESAKRPAPIDQPPRPSPEELEAIYHGMVDGVLIADAQTQRFLRANPAICRALGYTESELLSMRVHDIHPPEALPEVLDRFRRQWEGVLPVSDDTPVLRKDGSVYYADITTNRIVYRGRDCQIGFFRDVTERRRDRQQLERDRQRLLDLLDLHDRDRRLIGFEIHDGLAQWLAAAEMHLGTFREAFARDKTLRWDLFDAGLQLLRQGHQESRRLIDGLRIEVLEEVGLGPAIRDLVEQRKKLAAVPQIDLVGETNLPWLPQPLANCAFRIVQEGLANACRHSKSPNVRIVLGRHGNYLRLEVQDWGVGFHVNSRHEGRFGLESIVERARLFGGQASIESSPGHGTRITVDLPLPDELSKPNGRRAEDGEAGDSVSGSPREP
jgi:PAS domain S-box-containing protein